MPPEPGFVALILAAQRAGQVDPLAQSAGLSHKCVVPIGGEPLIVHVVRALAASRGLSQIRIVVEPEMRDALSALLRPFACPIDFVPAADNLADSVIAGAGGVAGPLLITTADNVLLTPGAVERIMQVISGGADVAVAMANEASVKAAHPEGQRRFYRFRDDAYSNCNLYALGGPRALAAAESFRSGGQFAKKPRRLIGAVGLLNVALMAAGMLTLRGALARLGKRLRLRIEPVVLADGSHAIDVDNERTYRVAQLLLEGRAQKRAA